MSLGRNSGKAINCSSPRWSTQICRKNSVLLENDIPSFWHILHWTAGSAIGSWGSIKAGSSSVICWDSWVKFEVGGMLRSLTAVNGDSATTGRPTGWFSIDTHWFSWDSTWEGMRASWDSLEDLAAAAARRTRLLRRDQQPLLGESGVLHCSPLWLKGREVVRLRLTAISPLGFASNLSEGSRPTRHWLRKWYTYCSITKPGWAIFKKAERLTSELGRFT